MIKIVGRVEFPKGKFFIKKSIETDSEYVHKCINSGEPYTAYEFVVEKDGLNQYEFRGLLEEYFAFRTKNKPLDDHENISMLEDYDWSKPSDELEDLLFVLEDDDLPEYVVCESEEGVLIVIGPEAYFYGQEVLALWVPDGFNLESWKEDIEVWCKYRL